MATQNDIARRVGLDLSSVNKILNRHPGATFRKVTIRRVMKAARELGYDLGRLKFRHRRGDPRKDVGLPLEIRIYLEDGSLFDQGKAVMRNISLSGAVLGGLVLPRMSLPLRPHRVGIRLNEGPLAGLEILGCPVRLVDEKRGLALAIRFVEIGESALRYLRRIV